MRVLSLFDGISCARVALGDRVTSYHAAEVDKNAIKVALKNFPDTVELGDVRMVKAEMFPEGIDLLVGGSPCQDLSIAKKDRKGLEGDRSGLFWEYVRILREVKPKWFILENVASMPKADRDVITKEMGVEPILLNAALVSAQCRKRLFWTNIPNVTQPADRGILLKDILQPDSEVDESMTVQGKSFCLTASYAKAGETEREVQHNREKGQRTMVFTATAQTGRNETKKLGYVGENDHQAKRVYDDEGKLPALNAVCNSMVKVGHVGTSDSQTNRVYSPEGKAPTQCKGPNGGATPTLIKVGHLGNTDSQGNRVYSEEGKAVTLSANGGGLGAKTGLYYVGHLEGGTRKGMEGQEHLSRAHPQCDRVYSPEGKAPTLAASETSGRTNIWCPTPYPLHVPEGESKADVRVGQEQRRKLKNGKRADNDPAVEAQRRIETRNDDKCGTLTTVQKDNHVVDVPNARIRKLTPIECERLQGLPDNYTEGIAKTNRYKCLGNAFNVDVVRHILSFVPSD